MNILQKIASHLPPPVAALALCLVLLIPAPVLSAGQWQTHDSIRQAVRQFILSTAPEEYKVQVQFGQMDERLRLNHCSRALEAFMPPHRRKLGPTTVGVRCRGGQPWKIFVPVQIRAYGKVLVANHSLPRRTVLRAQDVQTVERDLSRYNQGYYTEPAEVTGMVLKYALSQGSVLTPRSLEPKQLVSRGQRVTILAQHGGLTIRVEGEALMDGINGQTIRVRNTRSDREIQATVVAAQTVKVKM
jgi:flagella basal body P-ring formation protein FlgA